MSATAASLELQARLKCLSSAAVSDAMDVLGVLT